MPLLAPSKTEEKLVVLDAGAGNGRLSSFLASELATWPAPRPVLEYVAADSCGPLLALASARAEALRARGQLGAVQVHRLDLLEPGAFGALPSAGLVAAMGLLHHVPSARLRLELVRRLAGCVGPGGLLAMSLWQLARSPRLRQKIVPWDEVNRELDAPIAPEDLEPGDHALRFGGHGLRYCHAFEPAEVATLEVIAREAGLEPAGSWEADGREGDLNRYVVLRRPAPAGS